MDDERRSAEVATADLPNPLSAESLTESADRAVLGNTPGGIGVVHEAQEDAADGHILLVLV